jgi:AcrR family transcriptional regulator
VSEGVRKGPGRPAGGGDSRDSILDAAAAVFLRDGLGATTRTIAEEAGLTPAAIYHYFPNKKELLREAVGRANSLFRDVEEALSFSGEPEEVFVRMARAYVAAFRSTETMRFVALMLAGGESIPGALPALAERIGRGVALPASAYVQRLIDEGWARADVDPRVVVQTLFGSLFLHVVARRLLHASWLDDLDEEFAVLQAAALVAQGLRRKGA